MSNFRVGQKVVCVDDSRCVYGELVEGCVYTVAKVNGDIQYSVAGTFCQWLVLVETKPVGWYEDFAATRFRPVVERKTDISIFKAMLNTTPQKVGAA